jgi:ribosomal protein L35AE/L33A
LRATIVGTATDKGKNNPPARLIRSRGVTTPDEAQRVLLNRLGMHLPQRLRHMEEVVPM